MAALPYMQFYVADYLSDTMHLTAEEHGAYLLLIFNYWQTGKPLPDDDRRLCNIARVSNERWTDVKQTLNEFFVLVDGKLVHPRIHADLQFVEDKQNKASAAGKASAMAREAKKQAKINARSTDVATNVGTDVTTERQLESNHTDSDIDSDIDLKDFGRKKEIRPVDKKNHFEAFWKNYPKKNGRQDCQKKWISKNLDKLGALIIADVIHRKQNDVEWQDGFAPNPSTYLNGARWEDEIKTKRPIGKKTKKPDWAVVPQDDSVLGEWAVGHGYPKYGSHDTYRQYRLRLLSLVEKRLDQQGFG